MVLVELRPLELVVPFARETPLSALLAANRHLVVQAQRTGEVMMTNHIGPDTELQLLMNVVGDPKYHAIYLDIAAQTMPEQRNAQSMPYNQMRIGTALEGLPSSPIFVHQGTSALDVRAITDTAVIGLSALSAYREHPVHPYEINHQVQDWSMPARAYPPGMLQELSRYLQTRPFVWVND